MNDKITKALETVNELHGETLKKLNDASTICHDVDLLGDWLDAKGYTEEAGLCLRVLGLIHEQEEHINNLQEIVREDMKELVQYRAENEKLRAALKPFADMELWTDTYPDGPLSATSTERFVDPLWIVEARAAAAALKEKGDE